MNDIQLGAQPRCTHTHNPGVWPFVARCVSDAGHTDDHVDANGFYWPTEAGILPSWETWFKLLWNECVGVLEDMKPEEQAIFGLAEIMHGIAEDQPMLYTEEPDPVFKRFDEPVQPGHTVTIPVEGK